MATVKVGNDLATVSTLLEILGRTVRPGDSQVNENDGFQPFS